ncbi:MAG: D-2-hydroxyacid dehydrogenase, partial [Bryobacteraceae bacterium]
MRPLKLLVISDPAEPHLSVLKNLPDSTVVTIGNDFEALRAAAPQADVIVNGMHAGETLRRLWPIASEVQWIHSLSAGIENMLFPELIESPVPVTNARGVFRHSLAEFVIASVLFFAKDIRRLLRNRQAGRWEQFDMEEVRRQTLGIIGYGEIGSAAAERAKALGMKVLAVRRRPERSKGDALLDQVYSPAQLSDLMANSDYVMVATPLTPDTRGMIGEKELRAMKPTGVIINVGRGPVIQEAALLRALQEKWIRGAALDVFDKEPLPEGHPFW